MTILDTGVARSGWPGDAPAIGAKVAVRNRYMGTWSPGFEVLAVHAEGCRIKRSSDGAVLPGIIPFRDLRAPLS